MALRAGPFAAAETCFTMNASIQDPTETVDTFTVDALSLKCWWMCDDVKKVKIAHTRLQSVWFRSWSRFLAVSLQVMWVINPVVGCHYFPPGLNMAATNFAAWWTEARWVWTVCLRLLPDSVATAIWIQVLLRLSPARLPLGYRAICAMM